MMPRILDLLFDDPEVIRPFLVNLTDQNIDFLRRILPFDDIEELSGTGGYQEIGGNFSNISGIRFWEIFIKFAPNNVAGLIEQFPKELFKTLCEKIPKEDWVSWTDSHLKDNPLEVVEHLPDDIRLYMIYRILVDGENSIGDKKRDELENKFRETWFYFDRTKIREYPPELAKGLPSFVKHILKLGPPWSNSHAGLSEHWEEHPLGNWKTHLRRNWELEPAYIKESIEIPSKIRELYAETRRSYVYGQFKSSIGLIKGNY